MAPTVGALAADLALDSSAAALPLFHAGRFEDVLES